MAAWSTDQLKAIAETADLFVSPFREDGTTYGTPTQTWALVVDGNVYLVSIGLGTIFRISGGVPTPTPTETVSRTLKTAARSIHPCRSLPARWQAWSW
jgi:hypothetical protein